ncbi:MAG: polyketide synthase, partial [Cytophagales bacterium]|nr:polyketide synthase [Cytophagales bacterium]
MDIAIIGMGGVFPEAKDVNQFYNNLSNGRDSVRPLSRRRMVNSTIPLDANYRLLGFIEDIDCFDYQFFKFALSEAITMDPRQRLLLQVVYHTIENAGYNVDDFSGSDTSVFVGDTHLDYYRHAGEYDPTLITGNMNAIIAGRIARFFNLRGSAEMVDTACSSSLVAFHRACNELILGHASYALACGVHLCLFPDQKDDTPHLDIISPDGKARAFSAEANGTSSGETVGCVLLKPLAKALADKDVIHAVVKATAVNQDAALSASLTAPDSTAQSEVIRKAWDRAGIDPATISYIEAHGTGTRLGDPIEVEG